MFHIQTLNKISPMGLNKFDPANYTVDAPETTPDAIMVRSASMHDMECRKACWPSPEPVPGSTTFLWPTAPKRALWCSTPPVPTPMR